MEAQAVIVTARFDKRLPRRPLTRKPARGSKTSVRRILERLIENPADRAKGADSPFHQIDFVDVQRLAIAKQRHNDAKPDGCLSRSDSHDEEDKHLAVK